MKSIGLVLLSWFAVVGAYAQTVLLEEDFSDGIPADWVVEDVDQLTPQTQVSNFTSAWIDFSTANDTCAASTSYYTDSTGQSQDFLITPPLALLSYGNLVTWESKSFDANFPESYIVLVSTTDNLVGSFTDTIRKVNNDSPYWKSFTVNLLDKGYSNQTVYVAFKNVSTNRYILGIDNVKVTADDPATVSEDEMKTIQVYPNPVKTELMIKTNTQLNYQIFNFAGQLMMTGSENSIDVSNLVTGAYFIQIKTSEGTVNRKFFKE